MALVLLPGLTNLIDDISEEKKLPPQVVEAALREALLKGYERYRKTLYLGITEDPFDEEYFSNFDVGPDLEEEGPDLPQVSVADLVAEQGGVTCASAGAAAGWLGLLSLVVVAGRREE